MSPDALLDVLALPAEARHAGRIPKKLIIEQLKPRQEERALLERRVEELLWTGNLKAATVARAPSPSVAEIQVLTLNVREPIDEGERGKLTWLVHKGIEHYPVMLIVVLPDGTFRLSVKTVGGTARDTALRETGTLHPAPASDDVQRAFLSSLALDRQPFADLGQLYQGWSDRLVALEVARELGSEFRVPSPEAGRQWAVALRALDEARKQKTRVLRDLAKERQPARAAALSTERARLDGTLYRLKESLLEDPMPPSRR